MRTHLSRDFLGYRLTREALLVRAVFVVALAVCALSDSCVERLRLDHASTGGVRLPARDPASDASGDRRRRSMARPSGRVSRREVEGGGRLQGAAAVPGAVNFANRSMHEGAMAARLAVYNHPTHSTSGTGPGLDSTSAFAPHAR